ncbi:hypothetical protein AB0J80_37360 [Actinoplanes sp. NPDC049548]|uniref:hypothetical protein n=1 Tax=Actinoplanes sp. NPDC049548 TaxID=3155152 RepID=UPI00341F8242
MSESPGQTPSSTAEPVEIAPEPFTLTEPVEGQKHPEEKAPRSRTKTIVLGSLLAVSLAGAGVIGYAGWRIASQKDATLTAPPQIGSLKLDTSNEGKTTADYLQTALSAEVDLDGAVGAVYADSAGQNVLFFGGTTLIWTPENDLDTAFELVSDDQGAVTDLHDVSAGPLGGTMKCGTTKNDGADMPVCGWADHGSLALAMFPGRAENDSAKLLVEIRAATQKRN